LLFDDDYEHHFIEHEHESNKTRVKFRESGRIFPAKALTQSPILDFRIDLDGWIVYFFRLMDLQRLGVLEKIFTDGYATIVRW